MRRALAVAWVVMACGAPRGAQEPSIEDEVLEEAAGVRVLALPRPTSGRVWLSLWVDAGALDAQPPQLATVAAWTLDRRGRALAGGLELRAEIETSALDEQLGRWAAALRSPDTSREAVTRARARLVESRRAHAPNEGRRADALALSAAVEGPVDPLGAVEDDERVTTEAVGRFLVDHAGGGRLLVVAVGDVRPDGLRAAVERAFADLPAAQRERSAQRVEGPWTGRAVVGDTGAASLAVVMPSMPAANTLARALLGRLGETGGADVFPLRGGGVAMVRATGSAEAPVRDLVEAAAELIEEPVPQTPLQPPEGPGAIAAWYGARWAARGEAPEPRLALGWVIPGGRADSLAAEDPDAATLDAASARLSALLTEAREGPDLSDLSDDGGAIALANGARLIARREPTLGRAAVAVLFHGGAALEPDAEHGVTALAARLRGGACRAMAQRDRPALSTTGISVTPILRPDAWGVVVDGPSEEGPALASLVARCVATEPGPHAVEAARPLAIAAADEDLAILARAASPDAPGRIAPLGRRETLARLTPAAIARVHSRSAVGARTTVAVVTPGPTRSLARRLARAVGRWPAGEAPTPAEWAAPSGVVAGPPRARGPAAWVVWVGEAEPDQAGAGAALAGVASRGLATDAEIRVSRAASGFVDGHAWAAVRVTCTASALEALPARLDALPAPARTETETERTRLARRRTWAGVSARSLATQAALAEPAPGPILDAAVRLARRPPLYMISRPGPER